MKKGFVKYYVISWILILALFNIITFAATGWDGPEKYSVSFWLGYTLISASFAIQFIVSILVFTAQTAKELFYNLPAFKRSISMLVASLIFGSAFMLIPQIAGWIALVLYAVILILNTLKLFKSLAAAEVIEGVETKVKEQTLFIKALTVDANTLLAGAKSNSAKAECKKVYEAIRYSDPMSNDLLTEAEEQITARFTELSEAVKENDEEKIAALANEVVALVADRNSKCKILK